MVPADTSPDPYAHTVFALDTAANCAFATRASSAASTCCADPASVLSPLGPEPLADAFTANELAARLAGRRRVLKPLLLDQTFIAGVGNIYADEALFDAGLLPTRRSACCRLRRSLPSTLPSARC